ncbi:precorrin-2 dehydrogenase/sirohydrochlorin ferrochelatase family protein [Candidatus Methanodesulfokora washburnensis]|uniref:precorrin-2 dehydrogenase n=1 Tax=Candidatus Methanodesulfokora washburnensis TaxID=2478471 RepID=A0A3R9QX08_9CREN|nr:bifunctional precorrin-2 dehydrogenase/sirohydrochlorin ferrochelatase [Candidatus Methanodesulfokores washburnensis]RSN74110.1 bifunctional precorrin-2 dehydrogenase/sirohydrochlorin ferrochelatase [Candidatus Methanodesulfokores washburnensis]
MRIPMFIEMNGFRVLVVGGGEEGTKKARRFSEHGAEVRVMSMDFTDQLLEMERSGRVKLIRGNACDRNLLEKLIEESDLVVYTIGDRPDIERAVEEIAKRKRKLLNLATDADRTQVVMPIEERAGDIRIAVTSEGKSTLVVKEAAERVANFLREQRDIMAMLEVMGHLKKYMKERKIPFDKRMEVYRSAFRDEKLRELALTDINRAIKYAESLAHC